MDGRVEQLESQVAELEEQNRLLEKQRVEIKKVLAKEKGGKERATLYADSFVFKLIGTLSGLEKEVRALKCDLAAYEKANTDLQKGQDAAEVREDPRRVNSTWSARHAKVWFGNYPVFLLSELAWS